MDASDRKIIDGGGAVEFELVTPIEDGEETTTVLADKMYVTRNGELVYYGTDGAFFSLGSGKWLKSLRADARKGISQ